MIPRRALIAIGCAAFAVMISTGIRQSFGLFLQPITADLQSGRETFSLAIALNNLIYGLPLVGFLADWIGPRLVLMVGGLLYAAGLILVTMISSTIGLNLTFGLLVGLALSATTYVVVLGAVAQLVPPTQRTRTFGFITAAGSSGMFVVPPIAQFLLVNFTWQMALTILAGIAGTALAIFLLVSGWIVVEEAARWDERTTSTLQLPLWIYYLSLPVGAALLAFHFAVRTLRIATGAEQDTLAHHEE